MLAGLDDEAGGIQANVYTGSDEDSGCAIDEFTWIPAGLTPAQVRSFRDEFFLRDW